MAEQREASKPVAIGCVTIFFSPLWATGLWALIQGIRTQQMEPVIAGTVLCAAGLFPIYLTVLSIRFAPERKALYKGIRAIPAEWKPEWSAGRLADQAMQPGPLVSPLTIVLTAISLACGFFAFIAVRQGAWAGLLMLVVPLILVGFIIARIRAGMRKNRFGKSELLLDETPAHLGATLRANVIVEKLRPEEVMATAFDLTVTSIRRKTWTERSRGSTTTRSDSRVLWQGAVKVQGSAGHLKQDGLWVPFAIDIPRDQQATNDVLADDRIYWQLEASAKMPGIDYYSRFEVPVFV